MPRLACSVCARLTAYRLGPRVEPTHVVYFSVLGETTRTAVFVCADHVRDGINQALDRHAYELELERLP